MIEGGAGTTRWPGFALALALVCAAAPAAAETPRAGDPPPATHEVSRDPAAVRSYWTPRRMREAEPPPAPVTGPGAGAEGVAGGAPARTLAPARAAVDAGAGSASFPGRVHGKVYFTIRGGSLPGSYVCSGTVVSSNSHSLVWTAGHCVNDSEFGGGFATNWTFVPGYRDGSRPFGNWPASELHTTGGWRRSSDLRVDLGAATVIRDRQGRGIEDVLGARGIAFNRPREQQYEAFGYPAEPNPISTPPRLEFDGRRLYRCASPLTGTDLPPGSGPPTMEIGCDMTGGSSGGGWVIAGGLVNGLISYGYANDGDHLYGPYFGDEAEGLHGAAEGPRLVCGSREVTNLGSGAADRFEGTAAGDAFRLRGGADRARGGGGGDAACGGGGGDRLDGGAGGDRLRGGAGPDLLFGGPGHDVCVGGGGRDVAVRCERTRGVP